MVLPSFQGGLKMVGSLNCLIHYLVLYRSNLLLIILCDYSEFLAPIPVPTAWLLLLGAVLIKDQESWI